MGLRLEWWRNNDNHEDHGNDAEDDQNDNDADDSDDTYSIREQTVFRSALQSRQSLAFAMSLHSRCSYLNNEKLNSFFLCVWSLSFLCGGHLQSQVTLRMTS